MFEKIYAKSDFCDEKYSSKVERVSSTGLFCSQRLVLIGSLAVIAP
jgi:hypothetical protein